MALHLLLTYCGVYLAAKPIVQRWRLQSFSAYKLAALLCLLMVFATACFCGVWLTAGDSHWRIAALLGFELSLSLPLGCAWATVGLSRQLN